MFALVCIGMIVGLGVIAIIANYFDKGEETIEQGHDCSTCSAALDESCQLHCLMEEKKKANAKKGSTINCLLILFTIHYSLLTITACSSGKNTAQNRWWHSFNARYNTYFNGNEAFIEGNLEKEKGHQDNYTEMLPLYPVGNKKSRELGKGQYDRAIEKAEKAIKMHSIKIKNKEYNPFIWKAWMLLGKAQFQQGAFDEAAATFSYMNRLYQAQPRQNGLARAWLAKCYTELDWLYDAEDLIRNMNRDSVDFRTVKDWDYTYADYYLKTGDLENAAKYLRKVISHERRHRQKAREWYLMGQVQRELGHKAEAEKAFRKVIGCHPPYELAFNARIAQTEVIAENNARGMISRLKRMASNDNNKDFLDQVYYAMGNIYLAQRDTAQAIKTYEKGNNQSVRNGIEKGVLLLTLGNLYWQKEKYTDAQRCYGEAIGLLDKDRKNYEELASRSKVLDELVPYTNAIYLQDSLLALAALPEAEQLKVIDRAINDLKKREKEERRAQEEAVAEQQQRNVPTMGSQHTPQTPAPTSTGNGQWYFYNPVAVSQGKTTFQRQWGKRENADNWRRSNLTVVNLASTTEEETPADSLQQPADSLQQTADTLQNDPYSREYYLAQIPTTDDMKANCHAIIQDGLLHAGILFKDKLDNLSLSEKQLLRLAHDYPQSEQLGEVWYHLFLLYSRRGQTEKAQRCLAHLQTEHPESEWTTLLSDPYYLENARFGEHLEDSLYAATYQAFKDDRHEVVRANVKLSEERFPLGENRAKFIFIDGLSRLNDGDGDGCIEQLKTVVEHYPQSEVSEMAGMIIKGVQDGRRLYGGKFDLGDVWTRRDITLAKDSTVSDTLNTERDQDFLFILTYRPDSINENQLLYEMARYNFSNYLVRNFEIQIEAAPSPYDDEAIYHRMLFSGFLSYDEALQYARQLYADKAMIEKLRGCYTMIISEPNLALLGSQIGYEEYERFYEDTLVPLKISEEKLLIQPAETESTDPEDMGVNSEEVNSEEIKDQGVKVEDFDFGEDFW